MKKSELKQRILDISYELGLSHLSACLTAVDIIADIYEKKKARDIFILSQGHAGLALYVVLESLGYGDAKDMLDKCGIHPDRPSMFTLRDGEWVSPFDCSTGSLGHGLPIAVGMALADSTRAVYVLTSDGEMAEGSMYEALNVAANNDIKNLHIYINDNGYSAYNKTSLTLHPNWKSLDINVVKTNTGLPILNGIEGHYHKLTKEEYEFATKLNKAGNL